MKVFSTHAKGQAHQDQLEGEAEHADIEGLIEAPGWFRWNLIQVALME